MKTRLLSLLGVILVVIATSVSANAWDFRDSKDPCKVVFHVNEDNADYPMTWNGSEWQCTHVANPDGYGYEKFVFKCYWEDKDSSYQTYYTEKGSATVGNWTRCSLEQDDGKAMYQGGLTAGTTYLIRVRANSENSNHFDFCYEEVSNHTPVITYANVKFSVNWVNGDGNSVGIPDEMTFADSKYTFKSNPAEIAGNGYAGYLIKVVYNKLIDGDVEQETLTVGTGNGSGEVIQDKEYVKLYYHNGTNFVETGYDENYIALPENHNFTITVTAAEDGLTPATLKVSSPWTVYVHFDEVPTGDDALKVWIWNLSDSSWKPTGNEWAKRASLTPVDGIEGMYSFTSEDDSCVPNAIIVGSSGNITDISDLRGKVICNPRNDKGQGVHDTVYDSLDAYLEANNISIEHKYLVYDGVPNEGVQETSRTGKVFVWNNLNISTTAFYFVDELSDSEWYRADVQYGAQPGGVLGGFMTAEMSDGVFTHNVYRTDYNDNYRDAQTWKFNTPLQGVKVVLDLTNEPGTLTISYPREHYIHIGDDEYLMNEEENGTYTYTHNGNIPNDTEIYVATTQGSYYSSGIDMLYPGTEYYYFTGGTSESSIAKSMDGEWTGPVQFLFKPSATLTVDDETINCPSLTATPANYKKYYLVGEPFGNTWSAGNSGTVQLVADPLSPGTYKAEVASMPKDKKFKIRDTAGTWYGPDGATEDLYVTVGADMAVSTGDGKNWKLKNPINNVSLVYNAFDEVFTITGEVVFPKVYIYGGNFGSWNWTSVDQIREMSTTDGVMYTYTYTGNMPSGETNHDAQSFRIYDAGESKDYGWTGTNEYYLNEDEWSAALKNSKERGIYLNLDADATGGVTITYDAVNHKVKYVTVGGFFFQQRRTGAKINDTNTGNPTGYYQDVDNTNVKLKSVGGGIYEAEVFEVRGSGVLTADKVQKIQGINQYGSYKAPDRSFVITDGTHYYGANAAGDKVVNETPYEMGEWSASQIENHRANVKKSIVSDVNIPEFDGKDVNSVKSQFGYKQFVKIRFNNNTKELTIIGQDPVYGIYGTFNSWNMNDPIELYELEGKDGVYAIYLPTMQNGEGLIEDTEDPVTHKKPVPGFKIITNNTIFLTRSWGCQSEKHAKDRTDNVDSTIASDGSDYFQSYSCVTNEKHYGNEHITAGENNMIFSSAEVKNVYLLFYPEDDLINGRIKDSFTLVGTFNNWKGDDTKTTFVMTSDIDDTQHASYKLTLPSFSGNFKLVNTGNNHNNTSHTHFTVHSDVMDAPVLNNNEEKQIERWQYVSSDDVEDGWYPSTLVPSVEIPAGDPITPPTYAQSNVSYMLYNVLNFDHMTTTEVIDGVATLRNVEVLSSDLGKMYFVGGNVLNDENNINSYDQNSNYVTYGLKAGETVGSDESNKVSAGSSVLIVPVRHFWNGSFGYSQDPSETRNDIYIEEGTYDIRIDFANGSATFYAPGFAPNMAPRRGVFYAGAADTFTPSTAGTPDLRLSASHLNVPVTFELTETAAGMVLKATHDPVYNLYIDKTGDNDTMYSVITRFDEVAPESDGDPVSYQLHYSNLTEGQKIAVAIDGSVANIYGGDNSSYGLSDGYGQLTEGVKGSGAYLFEVDKNYTNPVITFTPSTGAFYIENGAETSYRLVGMYNSWSNYNVRTFVPVDVDEDGNGTYELTMGELEVASKNAGDAADWGFQILKYQEGKEFAYYGSSTSLNSDNLSTSTGQTLSLTSGDQKGNAIKFGGSDTDKWLDAPTMVLTVTNGVPTSLKVKSTVATSIDEIEAADTVADIYTLTGIVVKRDATREDLKWLAPGVYIFNGKRYMVK